MSIDQLQTELGWPCPEEVWSPTGSGPRVYAMLANRKIGDPLRRLEGTSDIRVGVLVPDSTKDSSQQPLALVCEFQAAATQDGLREVHRLAWNFSRAPLLITLEPHLIRAWSCCEPPSTESSLHAPAAEIHEVRQDLSGPRSLSSQAAQSLHWLELVTGQFFRRYENRFNRDSCADRLLLDNLRHVRQQLLRQQLSDDTTHDLLARLIFIQFLFDRKDSSGRAALNPSILQGLHKNGILSSSHDTLSSILSHYDDTYALFRWLDGIFNGDLFPGSGETPQQRETEWAREMKEVTRRHLQTIADFVSGQSAMKTKQRFLWTQYSFDAIPLEFISSIYEEFVTKVRKRTSGAVYTPSHVVDFVLDAVLPWDSAEWNVRVLDPACGSGIFLVKAFQRLVHRWRLAHPGEEPTASALRAILENNLFGVDIDPHAVRVASFSLYLAMCDEIDPKHYWKQVRFPQMRDRSLVCTDFFAETVEGISADHDAGSFDIVVGNAPWGRKTVGTSDISRWQATGWHAIYNSIGPVFLAKAAVMLRSGGRLSMLQSAGLILNNVGTARAFRRKLFGSFAVETVVNLAALRFVLFPSAVGPACILTLRNEPPHDEELIYICPKPIASPEDEYRIAIEPHDIHVVRWRQAAEDSAWWTALMWGGRRDVALIKRLGEQMTLRKAAAGLKSREGIIRGNQNRRLNKLLARRILEQPAFPEGTWLRLRARDLPQNDNPRTDSRASTDFSAFELPQLVIKQSWTVQKRRFEAAIVDSDARTGGVLCTQSYITVHVPVGSERVLEAACLICNSIVGVYFLFLTSSRLASYRPEPLVEDWLNIPLPALTEVVLSRLKTPAELDRYVFDRLELTPTDRALIEDAVRVTLADFKGDASSPGRKSTRSGKPVEGLRTEPVMKRYCEQFIKVLEAAFGEDKNVRATVFQEASSDHLPVRLVALHFGWPGEGGVVIERIDAGELWHRLRNIGDGFDADLIRTGYHRNARVYDSVVIDRHVIPTVYLVKPDYVRHWTRAAAIRDADEVCADFLLPFVPESVNHEPELRLA